MTSHDRHILLVEDNPADDRLLRELLREAGGDAYEVESRDTLGATLDRLRAGGIDLVLLDLGLPDSSGFETFSRLREQHPDAAVVLLTGLHDEELGSLAIHHGAQDYLVKGEVDGRSLLRSIVYAVERHQAEEALRRSEESYRSLVDNVPLGIFRVSASGELLAANPKMMDMLAFESEAALSEINVLEDLFVESDQVREFQQLMEERQPIDVTDVLWKRADGRRIHVRVTGTPTCTSAPPGSYEMIAEDVTHRLRLEAQLRHAQKMEAVGQLTGGIAHDFNNLLTVILGNIDVVIESLPDSSADLRADLADVRDATERGRTLVKKLLGFSRNETLERRPVDLARLVSDLSRVMRRVMPETIELRLEVDKKVAAVRVDPGAVEQILFNLATNARDAMPDGGTLRISVEPFSVDEAYREVHPWCVAGEYVCVSVSDSGCGMDKATQERAFDPFFTSKPAQAGTGLGMAMVYGLMKQHDGFVQLYSEVGKGTVVRLLFPSIARDVVPNGGRTPTEARAGGTERILVVEDEAPIRRTARKSLERFGYQVVVAADGEEALELLRQPGMSVDLVIADMVMPKLGGLQLLERLQDAQIHVRMILSSGYSGQDLAERHELPDGVPFLRKPWTLSELLARVREVLDSEPVAGVLETPALGRDEDRDGGR